MAVRTCRLPPPSLPRTHNLSFPYLLHKEGKQYKMLSGYTSEYICCGLKRFVLCAKCDKTDLRVIQNKCHEKYMIQSELWWVRTQDVSTMENDSFPQSGAKPWKICWEEAAGEQNEHATDRKERAEIEREGENGKTEDIRSLTLLLSRSRGSGASVCSGLSTFSFFLSLYRTLTAPNTEIFVTFQAHSWRNAMSGFPDICW